MKLSKLYTNRPTDFHPIDFQHGLNVVLAEIRLPENRKKDTHNLGKTTLGRLIDFCLLARRQPTFFLFKYPRLFNTFVFFLELELLDGTFVTVRRGVEEATKIAFKRHSKRNQNYSELPSHQWHHSDVPIDRAKELLDGLLNLNAIKPWDYRKGLGYLLRSQDDYRDVFQLRSGFKHVEWKPFLAHLLGFNHTLVEAHYKLELELKSNEEKARTIRAELGGAGDDISKIEGILLLKRRETEKKEALLTAFNFHDSDKETTKNLVEDLDLRITGLNAERYSLNLSKKKIQLSLNEDQILFNPDEAANLFEEVGILFPGQLKKDFEQLIAFNRAITDERRQYLREELAEIDGRLRDLEKELATLNSQRSKMLAFLKDTDFFLKYRSLSDELVSLKADISLLERQRDFLQRIQEIRSAIRTLSEEKNHLQTLIETDLEKQNSDKKSLFSAIRLLFSEIVEQVIDRKALLSVTPNKHGHLEFRAEILDESGNATSADLGHTYKKLLYMAFDMAVMRAHLEKEAPRFIFLDGVFESLDDRKKVNLLGVIREYAALGLQFVITLIDSEVPTRAECDEDFLQKDEVILNLHDHGNNGRLFKMESW